MNRFIPPDESPTAVLAGELAEHLQAHGHNVELIAVSESTGYRSGSKRGLSRAVEEILCHGKLFWKTLLARRGDLLLCLSSPACLPVTAAVAAALKRTRFAHWAMDVYPEIAAALDEIRSNGMVDKVSDALMNWAYGRTDLLVALDSDMQGALETKGHRAEICPPWFPHHFEWPESDPGTAAGGLFTWLYSGNLGRAHEWKCLLDAQAILEQTDARITLVFQGRGAAKQEAQAYAEALGLQRCKWHDYVDKGNLLKSLFTADLLIATQRPETLGLLWPSKLAVLARVPRPLLWVGPSNGAIAKSFTALPHAGAFSPDDARGIADWVRKHATQPPRLAYAPPTAEETTAGAERMAKLIGQIRDV